MADRLTGQHIHFLSLQTSVFCVECEVISENNTPHCFACGSRAVLSLSRVLGGSLRGQQTAHLIADAELDRLVRELLRTVPATSTPVIGDRIPASFATLAPSRSHARMGHHGTSQPVASQQDNGSFEIYSGEIDFEPAIHVIAERAQALTGATGAAIALRTGDEIVCRARTGRTAPDLGVRLQTDSGISAECVRTGEVVLCHDAGEKSPGGSRQLPPPRRALDSRRASAPFPPHAGSFRSPLRRAACLRPSRCRHHAALVQHDGGSDFPSVKHTSRSAPAVRLGILQIQTCRSETAGLIAAWRTLLWLASAGRSGSADSQRVRKSLYAASARTRAPSGRLRERFSTAGCSRVPDPDELEPPSSKCQQCRRGQLFSEIRRRQRRLARTPGMPLHEHIRDKDRKCYRRTEPTLARWRKQIVELQGSEKDSCH